MASQVILPKLTYEMQGGRIFEWLCAEGQKVSTGQPLFVIETDKATDEIPSDEEGVLLKILVPAGVEIPVGTVVAWIGESGETLPANSFLSQELLTPPNPATPDDGSSLVKQSGSSDKALSREDAPEEIMITPVAKRLARELGVDLGELAKQTGRKKIREADIKAFADIKRDSSRLSSPSSNLETQSQKEPASALLGKQAGPDAPEFEVVLPTPLQKAMMAHMTRSANIPQMAAVCEVDLTSLERFRDEHQTEWEKKFSYRLSYTHLLAVLAVKAVKLHPFLNASWTEQGIRLYRGVGLGVAMATQRGLVVPVVHHADEFTLEELAGEIVRLENAAKNNRLGMQDLEGGTFTLTNVGMLGIELSIPLIYPPQSAIMGTGAKRTKLVLENGQIKSAPVMSISIVSDHRMVDGALQGAFLQTFKKFIEDPSLILSV